MADLEALTALDLRHVQHYGVEPLVSAATVGYYLRSGHAFVVERDDDPVGFVLARALWDGERAIVAAARLVGAEPEDVEVVAALVDALTKSAYDAGVYLLEVRFEQDAHAAIGTGIVRGFRHSTHTLLTRTLGSRGTEETP